MDGRIKQLINESQYLPDDSRRENELAKLLRQKDQSEIFRKVKQMADLGCSCTLRIAKRVLFTKKYVKRFFWYGLDFADAHRIQFWLEFALPKLGVRSVISILQEKAIERPRVINDSLYFLPSLLKKEEYSFIQELKEYENSLEKQHIWKQD